MTRYVFALDGYVPKNRRYQAVGKPHPRIITTREYRAWLSTVAEQVKRRGLPRLDRGRWRLTVWTIAPTLRHLDVDVPHIDSDASLSAAKDALQAAGVLDDDVRVIEDRTATVYRKGERRLVVVLEQITRDPTAPDAELDLLLSGAC